MTRSRPTPSAKHMATRFCPLGLRFPFSQCEMTDPFTMFPPLALMRAASSSCVAPMATRRAPIHWANVSVGFVSDADSVGVADASGVMSTLYAMGCRMSSRALACGQNRARDGAVRDGDALQAGGDRRSGNKTNARPAAPTVAAMGRTHAGGRLPGMGGAAGASDAVETVAGAGVAGVEVAGSERSCPPWVTAFFRTCSRVHGVFPEVTRARTTRYCGLCGVNVAEALGEAMVVRVPSEESSHAYPPVST